MFRVATSAKKKSNIDLRGQRVVFTGALQHATRKQAAARAAVFGCVVAAGVSKNVDIVVAASGAGQKLDRAEELGEPRELAVRRREHGALSVTGMLRQTTQTLVFPGPFSCSSPAESTLFDKS